MVFGRLTVLSYASKSNKKNYWECVCACGKNKVIVGSNLRNGHTQSCGCLHKETMSVLKTKHASCNSKEYKTWSSIIQRCLNPNNSRFKSYCGAGIDVCDRWKKSFINFIADVGKCPDKKMSLDRINNKKGYSPDNCRWATNTQQARNKNTNRMISMDGETHCLSEWAEILNIPRERIKNRLRRGWDIKRCLSKEIW